MIPYPVQGTLWEATATDEAVRGTVTPIVSNLNARARNGETYRALFQVATPQGVNPSTLTQGQKTSGKVYFDVTGDSPDSVVYNAGGHDLALWVPPPPPTGPSGLSRPSTGSGSSTSGTPATPAEGTAAPANATVPPAGGTAVPTGSQGTPITPGSQGTPIPPAGQGTGPAPGSATPAANPSPSPAPAGSAGTPAANPAPTPSPVVPPA